MKHAVAIAMLGLLLACGGGGDFEEPKKPEPRTEEPPCKSIPIERRQEECGT